MRHESNDAPIAVLLHFASLQDDALALYERIFEFLSLHNLPAVVVFECESTDVAVQATNRLHGLACSLPNISLSITQPYNVTASLEAAIGHLRISPSSVALLSLRSQESSLLPPGTLPGGCHVATLETAESSDILFMKSVMHIASVIKKAGAPGAICVGYAMKRSRTVELVRQGILPLFPCDDVFFVPLDTIILDVINKAGILEVLDLILVKATDFLAEAALQPLGTKAVFQSSLTSFLDSLPLNVPCIDPLQMLLPVIDRADMTAALYDACKAARALGLPVRAPACHAITSLDQPAVKLAAAAGVSLPCIVKPRIACGLAEAHRMAFLLHPSGIVGLDVPVPAVLQEYVDHGGVLWKVYVAGEDVFFTQRRSTPDLAALSHALLASHTEIDDLDIPASLEFNSLESLPTSLPGWHLQRGAKENYDDETPLKERIAARAALMRPEFLRSVAEVLRTKFGLTLFGFDMVFDFSAGEAVIVDVNHFPSFKGIAEAPAAVRRALAQKINRVRRVGT